jgi:hypothetical protein
MKIEQNRLLKVINKINNRFGNEMKSVLCK